MAETSQSRWVEAINLASLRIRGSRLIAVLKRHRGWWIFALFLLVIDLLFIGDYAVTRAMRAKDIDPGILGSPAFRITADGGYPEIFNYAKMLVVVYLTGTLGRRTGQPAFLAIAAVYGMILLDDALTIHETFGEFLVKAWSLEPIGGVRAQDQGEILTFLFLGVIGSAILALGFRRVRGVHARNAVLLLVPIAGLVVFGIGVDTLYGLAKDAFPGAGLLLDSAEDGGEMICTTAAVAVAAAAWLELKEGPDSTRNVGHD